MIMAGIRRVDHFVQGKKIERLDKKKFQQNFRLFYFLFSLQSADKACTCNFEQSGNGIQIIGFNFAPLGIFILNVKESLTSKLVDYGFKKRCVILFLF